MRTATIVAGLMGAGTPTSWPGRLTERCCADTRMSGVGLAIVARSGRTALLATASPVGEHMEDLQLSLGEGPCQTAVRDGQPVLEPDLDGTSATRWPAFAPAAVTAGVSAAFAFPLQLGAVPIGVLTLYRELPGELDDGQLGEALAYTDAATVLLLQLQYGTDDRFPEGRAGEGRPGPVDLTAVLDRRTVVHQATGMISVQLDVGLAAAFLRLRGHAFAVDRPVLDVAGDVVARRLRFDHSEAGTSTAPPPPPPTTPIGEEHP